MRCCNIEPMIIGVSDNGNEIVYTMKCPKCGNIFSEYINMNEEENKDV